MSMTKQTRSYPTCDHHEVRCPQCNRSLADVRPHQHPLADAKTAKHCGTPCYGTAWYNHKPAVRHEYLNYAAQSPYPHPDVQGFVMRPAKPPRK